jgi:hypothetical protein
VSGSAPPAILPRSPQLCQNGGISEKSRVDGDDSHIVFGQKIPDEKGNVRQCVVAMQQPVLLSPKFGAKSSRSHHKTSQ